MKCYRLIAWSLLCMVPCITAIDAQKKVRAIRILESIQAATGAMALTSFALAHMIPEAYLSSSCDDISNVLMVTCFFSQLAHSAVNVAVLKQKKNKSNVARAVFSVAALFSIFKMTIDLIEEDSSAQMVYALKNNLSEMGDNDPIKSLLALIGVTGVLGQFGMLCYDCASADN